MGMKSIVLKIGVSDSCLPYCRINPKLETYAAKMHLIAIFLGVSNAIEKLHWTSRYSRPT